VLGRIPGTTSWAPLSADVAAAEVPGILVLLFATPLWYANAVHFRDEVIGALTRTQGTRILVLDALGMSDVDFTGSRALSHVLDDCERQHVTFGVARAGDHTREMLQRSGLAQRIGESHFYSSVNQAVTGLAAGPASTS
jgi:SulP family sulfate permease